ncbi:phosphotransferase enzyme family protein [Paenibacillus tepidiphilus]|uniref:phosphotransferase enzyme family protein n=1 Tax=Paenibacillus tepidiphilus TaxID=2608683 RepID=UPI00123C228F|nr:phosphotransferase [Paenibacillus tepidiphilus]
MNTMNEDNQRSATLNKARAAAAAALPHYGLEWDKIIYLGYSDSITFKIETAAAGSFLLRVHNAQARAGELVSELQLLDALSLTLQFPVPTGLAAVSGETVIQPGGAELQLPLVTVTRWVEGELLSDTLTDAQAAELGVMTGELHQAAATFDPPAGFTCPVWGMGSFGLEMERLKEHYSGFLTETEWGWYQDAAAQIGDELATLAPSPDSYGLIHGDLHPGNIIEDGRRLMPIDFGRCGYGYYLYDLAALLLGLSPRQRELCIEGYASVRTLPVNAVRQLECFFIMVMIGNYSHHAGNPEEIPGLQEEQPYALAFLREYLRGESFLFRRIAPVSPEA